MSMAGTDTEFGKTGDRGVLCCCMSPRPQGGRMLQQQIGRRLCMGEPQDKGQLGACASSSFPPCCQHLREWKRHEVDTDHKICN